MVNDILKLKFVTNDDTVKTDKNRETLQALDRKLKTVKRKIYS